jgi:predicted nuclease of predicted toxin-antitoxin system
MRFLVDAQLPRRIAHRLREAGYDVIHTLDLPRGNRTSDAELLDIAAREQRIVVTKDEDFVNSYVIARQPEKLLLISTGNITNRDLETLLIPHIHSVITAFSTNNFVELTRTALIVHT